MTGPSGLAGTSEGVAPSTQETEDREVLHWGGGEILQGGGGEVLHVRRAQREAESLRWRHLQADGGRPGRRRRQETPRRGGEVLQVTCGGKKFYKLGVKGTHCDGTNCSRLGQRNSCCSSSQEACFKYDNAVLCPESCFTGKLSCMITVPIVFTFYEGYPVR